MKNLSAAAHLIHGSSENRFRITYCPGHLTKEEVEGVGFQYAPLKNMMAKYDPKVQYIEVEISVGSIMFSTRLATGRWLEYDRGQ